MKTEVIIIFCLFFTVELRSRWYGPNGQNNYNENSNNKCHQITVDRSYEEIESDLDNYKSKCFAADSSCIWIKGNFYNSNETSYDCFWNKFSEDASTIRDFWNTNPTELNSEKPYQVCGITDRNEVYSPFDCYGISSWFGGSGENNYNDDPEQNSCYKYEENIDPDDSSFNPETFVDDCMSTKPSNGTCVVVKGKYRTGKHEDYECIWMPEGDTMYKIRDFWRTNDADNEEPYEVCSVQSSYEDILPFDCEIKSKYENKTNYDYAGVNNNCSKLMKNKYPTNDIIIKNLEKFKEDCHKADSLCAVIEGFYVSQNKTGYDCFYNKYNEDYDKIRLFWRSKDEDPQDIYEVCSVDLLDSYGAKSYTCRSKWETEGNNEYNENNDCSKVLDSYQTNELQLMYKETIKNRCFSASSSLGKGSCVFIEGTFLENYTTGIDCVWNQYNENADALRGFWRTGFLDSEEEKYDVCSIKTEKNSFSYEYKCKSDWFAVLDSYTLGNKCYNLSQSMKQDDFQKDKQSCEKIIQGDKKCSWIEGVYPVMNLERYDCFYDKYNERPEFLKYFYRYFVKYEEPKIFEAKSKQVNKTKGNYTYSYEVCSIENLGNKTEAYNFACPAINTTPYTIYFNEKMKEGEMAAIIISAIAFVFIAFLVPFLLTKKMQNNVANVTN